LFLDEPTTGVDPASRRDLWDLIRDLASAGTTVLLTTQYLEEADRLAERVAVIDHGRIVSEGTTEELKDRIGQAVVELNVPARDRRTALSALGAAFASVRADGRRALIVVPAPHGERSLHHVLHHLAAAGVRPDTVGLRKPTLEDVFLSLTGSPTTGAGSAAA
jgi:ABC-type multidrug transport system ATPase subunit